MRSLKVYGGVYDGRNRVIVAAPTKKAAFEAVQDAFPNIGRHHWNGYTSTTGNPVEVEAAMSKPGTVFAAPNDYRSPFKPVKSIS